MIQLFRAVKPGLYAGLLCLFLYACTNKGKVPSDVMAMEDMEKVMWDMIQADRYSSQFLIRDTSKDVKKETFRLYDQVFKLHKVSRDEFIESYQFYLTHPDISKVMFDSLSARASRERTEMYNVDTAKDQPQSPTLQGGPGPVPTPISPLPAPPPSAAFHRADSIRKAGMTKAQLRKEMARMKADSLRRADSLKKVNALQKLSVKAADSAHKREMLRANRFKGTLSPFRKDSALRGIKPKPIP